MEEYKKEFYEGEGCSIKKNPYGRFMLKCELSRNNFTPAPEVLKYRFYVFEEGCRWPVDQEFYSYNKFLGDGSPNVEEEEFAVSIMRTCEGRYLRSKKSSSQCTIC